MVKQNDPTARRSARAARFAAAIVALAALPGCAGTVSTPDGDTGVEASPLCPDRRPAQGDACDPTSDGPCSYPADPPGVEECGPVEVEATCVDGAWDVVYPNCCHGEWCA